MLEKTHGPTQRNLNEIVERLRHFVDDRDWAQFHDPKNLVMALSSEVGELTALFRWVASSDSDTFAEIPDNRARIELEMADVGICLILLAERMGMDLLSLMIKKIDLNAESYPQDASRGKAERPLK